MFLLLNNNKYLSQIVECLYYCLNCNNIKCNIVNSIEFRESSKNTINNNLEERFSVNKFFDINKIAEESNKRNKININNKNVDINKIAEESSLRNNLNIENNKVDLSKIAEQSNERNNLEIKTNNNQNIKDKQKLNKKYNNLRKKFNLPDNTSTDIKENNFIKTRFQNKEKAKENIFSNNKKKNTRDNSNLSKNVIKLSQNEDVYIIFNVNSIKKLPKNYIIYNFEQLTTERKWDDSFFEKCKNAIKVLDYSLENIKIFKKKFVDAYHLPFGWCSVLENNLSLNNKDIDVVFLGSLNKRRINIISQVNNFNYNIYLHNKCFDKDLEIVTSKSKVGLNIHFYEGNTILELTRIIPLICSGIHVISERSNDIYYDKIFNKIITFCKKEEMQEKIVEAVNNYDLNKMLKKKKKLKKKLNFEKVISENINIFKDIYEYT